MASKENDVSGFGSFISVLAPSIVVAAVYLVVFSYVRRVRRRMYSPRRTLWKTSKPPPPLPESLFGWIPVVLKMSDLDVLQYVGMDAVVMVRTIRFAAKYLTVCTLFGAFVIVPTNAHGSNEQTNIDVYSMSNIRNLSSLLWVHTVSAWVFTLAFFYLIYEECKYITELSFEAMTVGPEQAVRQERARHRVKVPGVVRAHAEVGLPPKCPELYTIVVTEIPEDHRTDADLKGFFEQYFPGQVVAAYIARDYSELTAMVDLRVETAINLDHARGVLHKTGDRPTHKPSLVPVAGLDVLPNVAAKSVDSIHYYEDELQQIDKKLTELRKSRERYEPYPSGFVTFNNTQAASTAAQCWVDIDGWKAEMAPQPSDVIWENLKYKEAELEIRRGVVSAASFWLVLFWSFPVAAISTFSTLKNLVHYLPFLKPLLRQSPTVKSILTGLLPTIALTVFMSLLPAIVTRLSYEQGIIAHSRVERSVVDKLYAFTVFNTFLVVTIAGTVSESLHAIINKPTSVVQLLGVALPKVSTFFTNYVVLNGLGTLPMELLRAVPLLLSFWAIRNSVTDRERAQAEDPGYMNYGQFYPEQLLIFTIVLTYATVAPIITPFGVAFFAVGYLTWVHQVVYVYRKRYESGGAVWPVVFGRFVFALLLYQLTLIGVVGLKYGYAQSPVLLPLPFLTSFFMVHCQRKFFKGNMGLLPLSTAAEFDKLAAGAVSSTAVKSAASSAAVSSSTHDALLQQGKGSSRRRLSTLSEITEPLLDNDVNNMDAASLQGADIHTLIHLEQHTQQQNALVRSYMKDYWAFLKTAYIHPAFDPQHDDPDEEFFVEYGGVEQEHKGGDDDDDDDEEQRRMITVSAGDSAYELDSDLQFPAGSANGSSYGSVSRR